MEFAYQLGDDPLRPSVPDRRDRLERWRDLGDPQWALEPRLILSRDYSEVLNLTLNLPLEFGRSSTRC